MVRTDFSDDNKWQKIANQIIKPDKKHGFIAHVNFVNDKQFQNKTIEELKEYFKDDEQFFFVIDSLTIHHHENPILCISNIALDTIDRFRVLPQEMWVVENNLSTANLFFEEFLFSVDEEGIHRM